MRVAVTVPATSANLGPGFDSFGLALAIRNRLEAELADEWSVEIVGEGAGRLRADEGNVAVRAMKCAFAEAGRPGLRARIRCENRIPVGGGLGSSSSAIVGGLLVGEALAEADFGAQRRLELATKLEGHPDNTAAALSGGFTICWPVGGTVRAERFEPVGGLAAVVVPANEALATKAARALLPQAVPHADAAFNVAHAGLLAAAIVTGRAELLATALEDRLHESYRASAIADLSAVRNLLADAGATGVALSGAGPTVIGLVAAGDDTAALELAEKIAADAAHAVARLGTRREPLALGIAREGARVEIDRAGQTGCGTGEPARETGL